MGQGVADVNLRSVLMDGDHKAALVSAHVEHCEHSHFVGMRKNRAEFRNVRKVVPAHHVKSLRQRSPASGVQPCEVV